MDDLSFEWDESKAKAKANVKKHGIGFEEAKSVFLDELGKLIPTQITRLTKSASSCSATASA